MSAMTPNKVALEDELRLALLPQELLVARRIATAWLREEHSHRAYMDISVSVEGNCHDIMVYPGLVGLVDGIPGKQEGLANLLGKIHFILHIITNFDGCGAKREMIYVRGEDRKVPQPCKLRKGFEHILHQLNSLLEI